MDAYAFLFVFAARSAVNETSGRLTTTSAQVNFGCSAMSLVMVVLVYHLTFNDMCALCSMQVAPRSLGFVSSAAPLLSSLLEGDPRYFIFLLH